jgi:hypothetical protein
MLKSVGRVVVACACVGIATNTIAAQESPSTFETQTRVRAAIEACMFKGKPRPFKAAESQSWNDFTYVGNGHVETFNDEATKWYREVCLPTITATLRAVGK